MLDALPRAALSLALGYLPAAPLGLLSNAPNIADHFPALRFSFRRAMKFPGRVMTIAQAVTQGLACCCCAWTLASCSDEGTHCPRVPADFASIGSAVKAYHLNAGRYPTTQQGLEALITRPTTGPLPTRWMKVADSVPRDPWGNVYHYRLLPEGDARGFEITSAGKDGMFGTEDDLSNLDPVD